MDSKLPQLAQRRRSSRFHRSKKKQTKNKQKQTSTTSVPITMTETKTKCDSPKKNKEGIFLNEFTGNVHFKQVMTFHNSKVLVYGVCLCSARHVMSENAVV
jgi:hypothetical protein